MPSLPQSTAIPQPVPQELLLPDNFPGLPAAMRQRFGADADEFDEQVRSFWTRTRRILADMHFDVAAPVNAVKDDMRNVRKDFIAADAALSAAFTEAIDVVVTAEDALATRTTLLESQVQAAGTGLLARVGVVETTYATKTYAEAKRDEAILASNGYADAAVLIESTARAGADGNLSGKYTLKVAAGDVVTGMNITSSSGPGGDVSDVTFLAASFKIYNGTSGVPVFQAIGGAVRVASLTILNTDVSGLGTLATQNSVSYGSITGTKPPTNADVTLSAINGGLAITGGGLQLLSGGAAIRGGQTAYDTGNGFWLGDVSGTTKFSLGSASGKMTWNGSQLTAAGFTLNANSLSAGSGSTSISLYADASSGLTFGNSAGAYGQIWQNGSVAKVDLYATPSIIGTEISADGTSGGIINLRNASTGAANISMSGQTGRIIFGTDTNLYRSASHTLRTDDSLSIGGSLSVTGAFSPGSVSTGTLNGTSGGVTGNWTVGGTLSAGSFSPSSISTGTINGSSGGMSGSWAVGGGSGSPLYAASGRLYFGAGGNRWFVSDGSGYLVAVSGSYGLKKETSDGWTNPLHDGSATIEFQASGGQIYGRINGGSAILLG